ncbi:MAG: HPr(Ser) kinase/phosphatase [Candidatus Thiodiazotropha sp. (ex Notomyrtea botanica)]|nr:HPr(Ser) kinase/phosphatase [Candidatus Thiodiazotropha sp. (ex Notomyrtea botanica)]
MKSIRTVQELIDALSVELNLEWDGWCGDNSILDDRHDQEIGAPAGPLNLIRPNQIQIIGPPEQAHLLSGDPENYQHCLKQLFSPPPAALLFTNGLEPTPECTTRAQSCKTAIITTARPDHLVIDRLFERFSQSTGETLLVHGVFMEVLGKGVLLSGDPAIGKSELALALISRGHRLIADDAAELYKTHNHTIMGRCPKVLQDFLEVRGLGLINIRAMFGNSAIKPDKRLHLIIDLVHFDDEKLNNMDRLEGSHSLRTLLDVEIPQTSLPVAAGRNLAILVETAVRQHMLSIDGYNAARDFIQRQQNHIDQHPKKSNN